MLPVDQKPLEEEPDHEPSEGDPALGVDPLLERVKKVAQRIIERVRRVTEDTDLEHRALPTDPTDEAPPISD